MENPNAITHEEAFDLEQLTKCWHVFTQKINKEDPNSAAILRISKPNIKDNHQITCKVPNELSKQELQQTRGQLVKYLRTQLKNDYIKLEINIETNREQKGKYIYTNEEKYKALLSENPHIGTLKEIFDLTTY